MDIRSQLLAVTSRKQWDKIADYIGDDQARFTELLSHFFGDEEKLVQLASQPVGTIGEKKPHLIRPHLPRLVQHLKTNPTDAVKRNTMRIFQFSSIPEEIEGELFDIGMNYLQSIHEPIAVKAFAMTALRRICERYPELAPELMYQIEILIKEEISAGITNRGKRELKKLEKLCKTQ